MSNIFKNGGGAGIGSYVIVFKDGQLAPDTDPLKLWGAYESGEQVYISVIDEETQDALVPASGWIDADSKLHLVARDFDDDKTYSVVLEYAPIASEMHIEGDVEEGITGGGVSKEEVEEMIADKADLVNGKVPAEQLPSYVDDILEFPTLGDFPNPGEEGKIYVALDTNYTYRWAGSEYVQVGGSEVDLSDYYRKEEVNALLDEKADAMLRVSLIIDEQTEQRITGHIDDEDAALLLEDPERPVCFDVMGVTLSPQLVQAGDELQYTIMAGSPEGTTFVSIIVSEESNSWEAVQAYGIDTLTNGLVEAQNNIAELQDNKQETLVSGENIKTINGESILGAGDIKCPPTLDIQLYYQPLPEIGEDQIPAGYLTGGYITGEDCQAILTNWPRNVYCSFVIPSDIEDGIDSYFKIMPTNWEPTYKNAYHDSMQQLAFNMPFVDSANNHFELKGSIKENANSQYKGSWSVLSVEAPMTQDSVQSMIDAAIGDVLNTDF